MSHTQSTDFDSSRVKTLLDSIAINASASCASAGFLGWSIGTDNEIGVLLNTATLALNVGLGIRNWEKGTRRIGKGHGSSNAFKFWRPYNRPLTVRDLKGG